MTPLCVIWSALLNALSVCVGEIKWPLSFICYLASKESRSGYMTPPPPFIFPTILWSRLDWKLVIGPSKQGSWLSMEIWTWVFQVQQCNDYAALALQKYACVDMPYILAAILLCGCAFGRASIGNFWGFLPCINQCCMENAVSWIAFFNNSSFSYP